MRLGEIDVPTLVVDARRTTRRTCAGPSQLIAREVLDGRLVTIEADHVVNLRAPEAFDDAVLPFLERARAALTRAAPLRVGYFRSARAAWYSSITFCARCCGISS